ncbi:sulfite exporter TauE/SafE family protein [Lactobacillus sp. Sy-1]|uniref:sulfite exporter TauE/SafE family protein n=1 Tax=Lactobacillus sp. Sy-1 TaxID=2109645 RepID=UPI001C5BF05D|nr:sulfite exporter TauE/SafE family protein [Lactobacillus sp. Sy-1]MBW1606349.1 sulfite exporter TauE/SafE family protein [Lactobacillus sp. Sy-1]
MLSISTVIILIIGGLIAGILNGIVGMAVLTLYPILLSIGVSPIMANVTATISIIFSGCTSVLSSAKEIKSYRSQTIIITVLSVIGCVAGTFVLINSSNAQFKAVVPFIIMLAGIMMLVPKKKQPTENRFMRGIQYLFLPMIGLYNGYFGAGSGILETAVLSRIVHQPYYVYNAIRNVLSLASNIISAVIFTLLLPVDWIVIIPLAIGLVVGGYLGPIIVKVIPTKIMEICVGTFAIGLACYLFITTY